MGDIQIQFDADAAAEYELRVEVGDSMSQQGLTMVTLSGVGQFLAEQIFQAEGGDGQALEEGKNDRRVKGEFDSGKAEELMRYAVHFPWGRKFPSRPGIPDEAIVVWEFKKSDGQAATLTVWLREAEQDPTLAPVLEALREGLARISHGEIYL